MGEWKEHILEDVIEKFIDYRGKTPQKTDYGIPLITAKIVKAGRILEPNEFIAPKDYSAWMTRGLPEIDDVVLTTEAPLGEIALIKDKNVALAQRVITLRGDKKRVDNPFLKYYFQSSIGQYELQSRASGTTVSGIKAAVLKKIPVFLPPLPEQKAIASVLSSLDDKIELLHRQNKTLEAMAEALFRQWFIVPLIRAERDGTIAEGFKNAKFEMWVKTTLGGDWGKENTTGDYVVPAYCIRGTDIADLNTGIPKKAPVRYVKKKKFETIEPEVGDIVIEISGGTECQSTGRAIYINNEIKSLFQLPLVYSNFCRLLKIRKEEYSFFVYLYLRYLYKQDEFFAFENGSSGIKNLDYKTLIFDISYPMPQERLVVEFDTKVRGFFKKINQNKLQIQTLEKLRDSLLPKLMSGEVRVAYKEAA